MRSLPTATPTTSGDAVSRVEIPDVGHRYVTAAIHTGMGGIASKVLQGCAPIVVARYLGPSQFGIYALVMSMVMVLSSFANVGQTTALQKLLPECSVKDPRRGGAILATTMVLVGGILTAVSVTVFFCSNWIATVIYRQPTLVDLFRFSALLVLSLALFNMALSVSAGLQAFQQYGQVMVIRNLAFLALGWFGVWAFGLYGALTGQLLACILGLILLLHSSFHLARKRFAGALRPSFSGAILGEIASLSLPSFLASFMVVPANWWANTLLARRCGFEQVGHFGVAFATAQIIMLLPLSLSTPAISFMSEVNAAHGLKRLQSMTTRNLKLIWAMTLPICVGVALMSKVIIGVIFGHNYDAAVGLMAWMSFAALVIVLGSQIGYAIASLGRMWQAFALNAVWLVIFLFAVHVRVPGHGTRGMAEAYAYSYAALALLLWQYSARRLKIAYAGMYPLVALTGLALVCSAVVRRIALGSASEALIAIIGCVALLWAEWRFAFNETERCNLRIWIAGVRAPIRVRT